MSLSPASSFFISRLWGYRPFPKSLAGPTLKASVPSSTLSRQKFRNMLMNFRKSFLNSASACRFVIVRAE